MEVPVSDSEKSILQMIMTGYSNIDVRRNLNVSFLDYTKLTKNAEMEAYIYHQFFYTELVRIFGSFSPPSSSSSPSSMFLSKLQMAPKVLKKKPNKIDILRLLNISEKIESQKDKIIEFDLIAFMKDAVHFLALPANAAVSSSGPDKEKEKYCCALYFISFILKKSSVQNINCHVREFSLFFVDWIVHESARKESQTVVDVFANLPALFEKKSYLSKYSDLQLYDHQKRLFQAMKKKNTSISAAPGAGGGEDMEDVEDAGGGGGAEGGGGKLVLYIAPTGTGKTLSPIGLATEYRVVFVCMARHIGLHLAKMAISMNQCVAFAFGCETASDIRLHYFSAMEYTKNRRSGGIGRVDHSVGNKVQMIICDIRSYLIAMRYMLAFNAERDIVVFWDEPTISMDYESHPMHAQIARNWRENRISKLILSCATLPMQHEIQDTIDDFKDRFEMAEVVEIVNYQCSKTISLLNQNGATVLPHTLFGHGGGGGDDSGGDSDSMLLRSIQHCRKMPSLMRYFDLTEVVRCCLELNRIRSRGHDRDSTDDDDDDDDAYDQWRRRYSIVSYFGETDFESITLSSAKEYYLNLLEEHVSSSAAAAAANRGNEDEDEDGDAAGRATAGPAGPASHLKGMYLTTSDAFSLTNGPSIYISENIENMGKFCISQSSIPRTILADISVKIEKNGELLAQIGRCERLIEEKERKHGGGGAGDSGHAKTTTGAKKKSSGASKKGKKGDDGDHGDRGGGGDDDDANSDLSRDVGKIMDEIQFFRNQIMVCTLDSIYIPNTCQHQEKWNPQYHRRPNLQAKSSSTREGGGGGGGGGEQYQVPFVSNIDTENVREIMNLEMDIQMKLLLMMGVGMFVNEETTDKLKNPDVAKYMELMKQLAMEQKLFLIIADTNYIYGTNYQFCHGFIGKDLTPEQLTQQKTIQAIGRIGRGNLQQQYTVRFRNEALLRQLFLPSPTNREAQVMSRLLSSK